MKSKRVQILLVAKKQVLLLEKKSQDMKMTCLKKILVFQI